MINSGAGRRRAPRGLIALRSAVAGLISATLLMLLALPANAGDRAEGPGAPAARGTAPGFDLLVGGFAVVVMVGFAGAVLWYVARNRSSE